MNSRERVLAAVRHQEADRVPLDLGTTNVTGITRNAYLRLVERLGVEVGPFRYYDVIQQLARMDEAVLSRLEVDTRGLMPNVVRKAPTIEDHGTYRSFTDEWGVRWRMPHDGLYYDLDESPLADDITPEDVDAFPWPDTSSPALLEGLREQAVRWHEEGYAVLLESVCAGIFEMACRVRGYEQFYMDLALNPPVATRILDKFVESKIRFYEAAAAELGGYIQGIREGDDLAGTEAMLMSPTNYRRYIKPRHAELFAAQRRLFPEPFLLFFHSDGAIYDVIPDFIELGIDVLNPVQVSAKGMTVARLKREFGRDLTFWGGAIDPLALARSAPQEVEREVRQRIEDLAPGGGYVFGAIHNIQDDVPPENVLALWEAFRAARDYSRGAG